MIYIIDAIILIFIGIGIIDTIIKIWTLGKKELEKEKGK